MANLITVLRIILAFFATGLLFCKSLNCYVGALVLTAFVLWMDGLDGFVARKFNEASKFGAVLDILADRIVENVYWVVFATLGWIGVWVPLVVLTRGIITDGLRSVALEQGFTAFGSDTMMQSRLGKFLVASNFSRFSYALTKALAFVLMIAAFLPVEYSFKSQISLAAYVCVYIAVTFCVLRGIPVIIESKRFFPRKNSN